MNHSFKGRNAALIRHLKKTMPLVIPTALEAGGFIRSKFGRFRSLTTKADTSLVTEVDKKSEGIVLKALKKHFPHDHIMAEETGLDAAQDSSFCWHIDPLDGTTNFVHGFPFFCVSIGLAYEGAPVLGVLYQPMTNQLYHAHEGAAAFCNKKRLYVSKTSKLSDGLLSTGFSVKKKKFFASEMGTFAHMVKASHAIRRTGSAALDLSFVATGQFDGFWERGLNSWDVCAALAVLNGAGGTFSRLDGRPYQLGNEDLLASNALLHRQMIRALRA